jgi:hypothetical protein
LVSPVDATSWKVFKSEYKKKSGRTREAKRRDMHTLVDDNVIALVKGVKQGTDDFSLTTDTLVEVLDRLFNLGTATEAYEHMKMLKMKGPTLQDVIVYHAAFEEVLRECKGVDLDTQQTVDFFVGGLRPAALRDLVGANHPKSAAAAASIALVKVAAMEENHREVMLWYGAKAQAAVVNDNGKREGSSTRQSPPQSKKKRMEDIECYNCGRKGHRQADCRVKPRASVAPSGNQTAGTANPMPAGHGERSVARSPAGDSGKARGQTFRCFHCKAEGHKAYECPNKK